MKLFDYNESTDFKHFSITSRQDHPMEGARHRAWNSAKLNETFGETENVVTGRPVNGCRRTHPAALFPIRSSCLHLSVCCKGRRVWADVVASFNCSDSPGHLEEKVSQLEAMLRKLQDDLQKVLWLEWLLSSAQKVGRGKKTFFLKWSPQESQQ